MLLRSLFLACLISASCLSLSQQSDTERSRAPVTCPVTKPSDRPLVAPSPYLAHAGWQFLVWYGQTVDHTSKRRDVAASTKDFLVAAGLARVQVGHTRE